MEAVRYYWEYQKWKLILIAVGLTAAIGFTAALIVWFTVGLPALQGAEANFFDFFGMWAMDFYSSVADIQTYLVNNWPYLLCIIGTIIGFAGLLVSLSKKSRHRKAKITGFSILILVGVGTFAGYGVANGFTIFKDTQKAVQTHQYVLISWQGQIGSGDCITPAWLTINQVDTPQLGTLPGIQNAEDVEWVSRIWETQNQAPANIRIYVKIYYSDGSNWEKLIREGGYEANSPFSATIRVHIPEGKTPIKAQIWFTELDYFWIWHFGWKTVYDSGPMTIIS